MKVAFIGNCCNNHYVLVKELRKKGIDAHLFLTKNDIYNFQNLPESEDFYLKDKYPDWIHTITYSLYDKLFYVWPIGKYWKKKLLEFDIVHTHANYAPEIRKIGIPYVIHPYGTDFFTYPFRLAISKKIGYINPYYWFTPLNVREAIRKADSIILSFRNPLWKQGYKLLQNDSKVAFIPLGINLEKYKYGYKSNNLFKKKWPEFNFFVLQVTRQSWRKETVRLVGGDKGNDVLIRAFAKFCKIEKDAVLVLIRSGSDINASESIIKSLKIEKNVRWIEPVPREKLLDYFYSADITVDSLNTIYGGVGMESMSCGVPLMMNLKIGKYDKLFGEIPPCIHIEDEKTIFDNLSYFYKNREKLMQISKKERAFVEKYHDVNSITDKLLLLYNDILNRDSKFPNYVSNNLYIS